MAGERVVLLRRLRQLLHLVLSQVAVWPSTSWPPPCSLCKEGCWGKGASAAGVVARICKGVDKFAPTSCSGLGHGVASRGMPGGSKSS